MCTYSQIKKICATPTGGQWRPLCPQLYTSSGIDISKCIEGGNMKFTTLVDYICIMCVQSRMHFRVMNVTNIYYYFFNVFNFLFVLFVLILNLFFLDLVKAKPIRYCIELPV